jgi:hypothetical protein
VEIARAARRRRSYGLPIARLGSWDGQLYAKSEHGSEFMLTNPADVPDFIARLFEGVDVLEWALGREQVTLYDDGRVERVTL